MNTRVEETVFTSFVCPACQQEIEAPAGMASETTECPACAESVQFSPAPHSRILWNTSSPPSPGIAKQRANALKNGTIRIELPDSW